MSFGWGFNFFTSLVVELIWAFQLVIKGWAIVDASTRRPDAYPAVDRLTKKAWLIILGIALATGFVTGPLSFFSVVGDVAAGVYLLDVRPRLRAITGR